MQADSDEALLSAWQQGDKQAGSQLFKRYIVSMERFFRNKQIQAADEYDLVQRVFLGCVKGAPGFRGDASFRTYLFKIARNVLGDYLRAQMRRPQVVDLDQISVADLATGVSTLQARNRQHALLLEGLRAIPVNDQTVLELYYWEKMTALQIGEIIDLAEPAVRGRIGRAKKRLFEAMKQRAQSPEELRLTLDGFECWADELRVNLGRDGRTTPTSGETQP